MIKPSNMTSNCPTCCHKSFIVSKDIIFLIVLWIMNFFLYLCLRIILLARDLLKINRQQASPLTPLRGEGKQEGE